jgi:hypothetical protein
MIQAPLILPRERHLVPSVKPSVPIILDFGVVPPAVPYVVITTVVFSLTMLDLVIIRRDSKRIADG